MDIIWKYLKNNKGQLFLALGFSAIGRIASLFDFQIFRLLVDNYVTKAQTINRSDFITGIFFLLFLLVVIALVSRLAASGQFYFTNLVVQKTGSRLYSQGMAHALAIPYRHFEDQSSGEILQKLQSAREFIQVFVFNLISGFSQSLVGVIFVIVFAFWINLFLGLIFLAISVFLTATIFILSYKTKSAQKEINKKTINLAGSLNETLRNVELIKGMGLEEQETARLNSDNDKLLKLNIDKIKLIRRLEFFQGLLINLSRIILLAIMLWLVYRQAITLGEFFSLFFYISFVFSPLVELGNIAIQYHETIIALEQLETVLNIPLANRQNRGLKLEKIFSLSLNKLCFDYFAEGESGVKNINLAAEAGETIALVGPSGCGKTTLVKILVGLYRPDDGQLFFNQNDSSEIDFNYVRQKIGLVSQETQLFAGSFRDNLLFVNPEATESQCLEVLKNVLLLPVVERGDKGLDTLIGEGGMKLSGGERQRLAIARALLRQPDLLIFDEATSSLDSLTEREITQTVKQIERQFPGMITILVSHRLSTIYHAKKIFVMEKGEIINTGSHGDLIKNCQLYSDLWQKQQIS